jgi:hypothetical protein
VRLAPQLIELGPKLLVMSRSSGALLTGLLTAATDGPDNPRQFARSEPVPIRAVVRDGRLELDYGSDGIERGCECDGQTAVVLHERAIPRSTTSRALSSPLCAPRRPRNGALHAGVEARAPGQVC